MNKQLEEIICDGLIANGYDGLLLDAGDADDVCGCWVRDLMPCGEISIECQGAYEHSDGNLWFLREKETEPTETTSEVR